MTGSGSGPAAQPVIEIQQALGRPIAKANHYLFVPRLANSNARNADARSRLRQPKHEASCGHRETAQRKHVGLVAGFGGLREMCVRVCAWARGRLYTLRCNCCVSKYNRTHRAGDDCCRMSFAQGIVAERFVEQKVAPKAAQKEDQKVGPKVRQKAAQKADQKVDQNVFTKELLKEMLMTKPQSRTM